MHISSYLNVKVGITNTDKHETTFKNHFSLSRPQNALRNGFPFCTVIYSRMSSNVLEIIYSYEINQQGNSTAL